MISNTHETVRLTEGILQRAEIFEQAGMDAFDAIHLASAEDAGADVLLTTDDRFIKICKRSALVALQVENPVRWLEEILDEENDYLTLSEIRVLGFETLLRELGPAATIRFMQQYEAGRGNYTRDRHKWLPKQNVREPGRQIMDENAQPPD